MRIQNKVYVVTGGGNGIGRELVLQLLSAGAKVAAVDIDEGGLQETAKLAGENSANMSLHILDITDREAVSKLPESVISEWGAVDGLINNAGIIQPFVKSIEIGFDAIDRVMNINFNGTVNMTKVFLPHFLERPEAHIVNVSSMGGFLPVPGQGVYGASKAAVKLFTESLYAELLGTRVHVSVVFPGAIGTDIAARSGVVMDAGAADEGASSFNPMPPEEAAAAILKGIEKDKFRILVGSDAKFMNFLYRLSPKFATKYIVKQMGSLLK
jgi:short-subunit dehydrogenase